MYFQVYDSLIGDNRYYEKVGSEVKDITDDLPFEIPDSWVFVRLSTVCWLGDVAKSVGEKLPYLDAKTLRGKSDKTYLSEGKVVDVGEKVILVDGENSGEVFDIPFRGYMGSTFKTLETVSHFNFAYLNVVLDYYRDTFCGNKIGAAIPHLNKNLFKSLLIGIPPLAEQSRIVFEIEKYEPLIAEYDKLEQQATKLDEEIYDKLKKSILQYAIQGKLVPQDPNDEPASVLLERISAEKKAKLGKKFVDSYIYKGDDNCYYEHIAARAQDEPVEVLFDIPENWAFTRLDTIIGLSSGTNLTSATMAKSEQIYPVFGGNGITGYYDKYNIGADHIIIGRVGFYCGSIHVTNKKSWITDNALIVSFDNSSISTSFFALLLESLELGKKSSATAQPLVTGKIIKPIIVALPPLAEQNRIVAKINEIFAML